MVSADTLTISGLSVRFGGLAAVNDVDLEVGPGQRLGIIGPNGAGKSTLFNAISGRVCVAAGRLTFGERDITRRRSHERAAIGIVQTFQNIQLFPSLSVIENVMTGAHLNASYPAAFAFFGLPVVREFESRLSAQSRDVLSRLDLVALADRRVFELPYALQKRVELARALMVMPKVLLLDEPATGLNDFEKAFFIRMIRETQQAMGFTLIVIEHDVPFLSNIVDHMAAMNFGQIIARGSPDEVIAEPQVIQSYTGE